MEMADAKEEGVSEDRLVSCSHVFSQGKIGDAIQDLRMKE